MIKNITGYSYNDLTIIPSVISKVSSRSECNPFINENNLLPIFTAPMASVVNEKNLDNFNSNGIIPILPRNISLEVRKKIMNDKQWVALSLKEFEDLFINNYIDRINNSDAHYYICVDIANGHMESLYSKCHQAKKIAIENNYELTIMTGNIANPQTYRWICDFNYLAKIRVIDYIRVGIGGGSGCITTSNVSIHYPQASLIDECYRQRKVASTLHDNLGEPKYDESLFPKIIADGGIRNYDHVIKALALGADYVMIGSLFAQCMESAGEKFVEGGKTPIKIDEYEKFVCCNEESWKGILTEMALKNKYLQIFCGNDKDLDKNINGFRASYGEYTLGKICVKFFGMASSDGQKSISGEKTKTAEGITKYLPVKYTLKSWVDNMISYLRSAMSYTNCSTLDEFIGTPDLIVNSISEIHAVNK